LGRRIHLAGAHLRRWVQAGTAALTNGYYAGFFQGKIYTGGSKAICVPGLNCYSCPGALGACPLGSLQAVLGSRDYRFAFYVVGFLMLAGVVLGRFVCGWLCPFGLIQEALHKIPVGRKLRRLPGERWLKCLKYVLLAVFVILLPLYAVDAFGQGTPAFCKFICPAGTLEAGHPLLLMNTGLRAAVGWLFVWKNLILLAVILFSVFVFRPFCRYLCPLGAIYGFFHPVAFLRYGVDGRKCTECGACRTACRFDIEAYRTPNSPACIRCGDCLRACPEGALFSRFGKSTGRREENEREKGQAASMTE